MSNLQSALFLLIALVPSLTLHEYAHGLAADKLGDPTPRRWGRLTLNPRRLVDPFGSVILPGLILILVAAGRFVLPLFAYAKPMPLDPSYLKRRERDRTWIALAGPAANLLVGVIAGFLLRVPALHGIRDLWLLIYAFLYVNLVLFVFNLMPIPGLDGARLLARYLPPRAREVYGNLDQYLVLFMLGVFFLFHGPLFDIVDGLTGSACRLLSGFSCS